MNYPEGTIFGLPNCGIVANAYVAKISYDEVWNWFLNHNSYNKNWKGRTYHDQYEIFLSEMKIKFKTEIVKKKRLKEWCKDKTGKWLIHVTGHSLVFEDGLFLDQHQINVPIEEYKYKGRYVDIAWKIIG